MQCGCFGSGGKGESMINESLWGALARERREELVRQSEEYRRAAALSAPGGVAGLLIGAGRSLERLGERLAGGPVGGAAVGGIR